MNYYEVDIWYTASGYRDGSESTAMHVFYEEAETYGQALEKAWHDFKVYEKAQTRPGRGYSGLTYTAERFYVD